MYCTKCGSQLVSEARFCNICGAPVEVKTTTSQSTENPYENIAKEGHAKEAYVYTAQPSSSYTEVNKNEEELRAEEQALLDRFNLGLKHERLAWKIGGIVWTICTAFVLIYGSFIGIFVGAAAAATGGEAAFALLFVLIYFFTGFMFLPIAIINFSMKNKLDKYRAKLYTDCRDGIGHFSVGSIVFCAFFNGVALIFNIVYFIQAKNNAAIIERIKANQESQNSQQ